MDLPPKKEREECKKGSIGDQDLRHLRASVLLTWAEKKATSRARKRRGTLASYVMEGNMLQDQVNMAGSFLCNSMHGVH